MGKHSKKWLSRQITPGNLWQDLQRHWLGFDKTDLRFRENYINYWANFFEFSDGQLEKRKILIFQKLCEQGICGIQKIGDDYLVYDIASYTQALTTDIISGRGLIVVQGKSTNIDLKHKQDAVIVMANRQMIPWFDFAQTFMDNILDSLSSLEIARQNATKTKFIRVDDKLSNQKDLMLKDIHSGNSSVVVLSGQADEVQDLSFENTTDKNWEDVWNSLQFYLYNEGMRFNSLEKSAEVKEVEAKNDAIWFEMLENARVRVVQQMVDDLNDTFGTNITFKTIIQIKEEKEQEKMQNAKNDMQTE